MARFLPTLTTITSVAVALLTLPVLQANAAGPYDGRWVLDAPEAGGAIGAEGQYTCPALRLPLEVKNGRVIGELHRTASNNIVAGAAPNATPIHGAVKADGDVDVTWQGFHATGRLHGTTGSVHWAGECGPRTATVTKVP